MKTITLLLTLSLAATAADAPKADLQVEYTKALLDLANAQSGRLQMLDQIKKAQAESDDAMAKGQSAVQTVLQKKSAECSAMTPPRQLDTDILQSKGVLACKEGNK